MGFDRLKCCWWMLMLLFLPALAPSPAVAAESSARPKLYDTAADGNQQIAQALKTAKAEDKRIILKFGANW